MTVSSDAAQPSAPELRAGGPKRAFAGRLVWVLGADGALGRAIAVELAGRGAEVWAVGSEERKLGEAVGEIAYQGGWARHVVLPPGFWSEKGPLSLPDHVVAPAHLVVVATPVGDEPVSASWFEALLARIAPALAPGGVCLFASTGAPSPDLASWLRRAARAAARSERGLLVNAVVLGSAEGDCDGAARIAALLCSGEATGLTGQLVVVASA